MDKIFFEKLQQETSNLRYENMFFDDIQKNKDLFLYIDKKTLYNYLAKIIFMNFNNKFANFINSFLKNDAMEETENVMNWFEKEYHPLIDKVLNNLNILSREDLANLSLILDNQWFFINNVKETNLKQLKLTIYEVPFEIRRQMDNMNLLKTEDDKEEILIEKIVFEYWQRKDKEEVYKIININKRKYKKPDIFSPKEKSVNQNYFKNDWRHSLIWVRRDGLKTFI